MVEEKEIIEPEIIEDDKELDFSDENNFQSEEFQEDPIDEIPRDERKLRTQAYDKSISDIVSMIKEGDIILNPDYQRNYVWDNSKASLLIESILLNVPIPVVYMAEDNENRWNVVDGLQRLYSLKRFFSDEFKLSKLEILPELKGLKYSQLNPKAKRILRNGIIRIIVIFQESHHEIKYDIFMRLNGGAIKLNEQELRNCLYRGSFNDLLKKLRSNEKFLKMMGLSSPHKRFLDAEVILRYFTIADNYDKQSNKMNNYAGNMKTFLNNYMKKHQNLDNDALKEFESRFESTISNVYKVFGDRAFMKINQDGNVEPRLNRAIMDCLMVSLENRDLSRLETEKNSIVQKLKELIMNDDKFYDSISAWTSDKNKLNYRLSRWNAEFNTVFQEAK